MKTIAIEEALKLMNKTRLAEACGVSAAAITKAQKLNRVEKRNYRIEMHDLGGDIGYTPIHLGEDRGWVRVKGNPREC